MIGEDKERAIRQESIGTEPAGHDSMRRPRDDKHQPCDDSDIVNDLAVIDIQMPQQSARRNQNRVDDTRRIPEPTEIDREVAPVDTEPRPERKEEKGDYAESRNIDLQSRYP